MYHITDHRTQRMFEWRPTLRAKVSKYNYLSHLDPSQVV
jgi:hypothetical protein